MRIVDSFHPKGEVSTQRGQLQTGLAIEFHVIPALLTLMLLFGWAWDYPITANAVIGGHSIALLAAIALGTQFLFRGWSKGPPAPCVALRFEQG